MPLEEAANVCWVCCEGDPTPSLLFLRKNFLGGSASCSGLVASAVRGAKRRRRSHLGPKRCQDERNFKGRCLEFELEETEGFSAGKKHQQFVHPASFTAAHKRPRAESSFYKRS
mmetsp:Transcript_97089/g.172827  ORF Transcript_97089/g.172827 Transcript_97089/m.172827 type:complete len:114 (-) Transcript_97089:47-388(-)